MAESQLKKIFLSASIPLPERNPEFYETADFIAIRDSIRALSTVIIPNCHLVWGGHPSITPIIRYIMMRMDTNLKKHVTLYQSTFFEKIFPKDNFDFENIILTEKLSTREESLKLMRTKMLSENNFSAGVFIGGMEGILDEYFLFKTHNPNAIIIPVASTGAATKIMYDNYIDDKNERFVNDYSYMSLFNDLLLKHL
ncbi:hypothetical protein Flavo103_21230 [Flavobacterium collinsii]|uniref:SLOG domain-containing protein n=1 Tax=Flavobacterium collinsii TaxID=1114861 RepID=UPI0022BD52F5|nr:hypothetical protein [Flavobacterium collinsii]GIQ58987.1 hypothetical protein Flavo103_21230 [Flavobacterium collinsii]